MNLLELIGLAVRDGVYEVFMEVTKTTDLKELKEGGYVVKEVPLSPDLTSMDRLYILTHGDRIICSCSLVVEKAEPVVKVHTPLETKEVLRRLKSSLGESLTKGNNKIH
jgi:hypothetical protein